MTDTGENVAPDESNVTYELITTREQLDALCDRLEEAALIAVDTETEGLAYEDIIVGIAVSAWVGEGYYIPIRHEALDGVRYADQLTPEQVYERLGPILEDKPCTGHNVKFDMKMFWKDGININYTDDTLIYAHLIGKDQQKGLKPLVKNHLGHKMNDIDSLFPKVGRKKPEIRPAILSPEEMRYYGCEDGNWSYQLYRFMKRRFENSGINPFLYALEMRLLRSVGEMEAFGIPTSMEFLVENSKVAVEHLARLEQEILTEIREEVDDPEYMINFNSPTQLAVLLFDILGLPVLGTSPKTGNPSTAGWIMEELAKESPVVRKILTYRELNKLNNTYLHGLQSTVHSDGRIRGSFNQVGTASGRFSSSSPNLQNLPRDQKFYLWDTPGEELLDKYPDLANKLRKEDNEWQVYNEALDKWGDYDLGTYGDIRYGVKTGRIFEMWQCKTRSFIAAPEDHYLIEADYSQIELRVMAGESLEPTLLDAYASGEDVHSRTAAVIFGVPDGTAPTDDQRQVGKTINFSLLYGAGPFNISKQLGIEVEEAQEMVGRYFKNLPAVKSWLNRVRSDTHMDGYADTAFGRRRYFPNVRGGDHKLAEKELREAGNHHIQGSAADVMKLAIVRASTRLRKYFGDDVRIISTVHDSVLVECHNKYPPEQVVPVLRDAMENLAGAKPADWPELKIDTKIGKTWGTAKEQDIPRDTPLPEPILDPETEWPVRVRRVAHEREYGQHTVGDGSDVAWILEVYRRVSGDQLRKLLDFLEPLQSPDARGSITLICPDSDGVMEEIPLPGRHNISFDDEISFKLIVGQCKLKQDLEHIDVEGVLRGIDFGIDG